MPALDGIRILDMTQWEAGSSCTQALAWLGADVVKVEPPVLGDPGRGRRLARSWDSEYFVNWNSNKRSITLDLQCQRGRQILLDMAPQYDVFIENYGPGVIEKLDIGYDIMKAAHPEIIYVRIKGFGTSGPYAHYKCMDMVAQAAAGAFSVTGEPDGPPMRPGPTMADAGTGMQAALTITAALVQRMRTGKGQLIELSMQEAMTYYVRTSLARTGFGAKPAPRSGNIESAFMALYPCHPGGSNDYVFVIAVNPRMWTALMSTIGKVHLLAEERFKTARARLINRDALFEEISEWTSRRTKQQCMQEFSEAGICASAVFDTKELYSDPHLQARDFIKRITHPYHGEISLLGWPVRMSESSVELVSAPLLGEHTDEVLKNDLGVTCEELDRLRNEGVIGCEKRDRMNQQVTD